MLVKLTRISLNKKIGPIPCTISSKETCPPACPLKNSGCYADSGPLAIHWNRLSKKEKISKNDHNHNSLCDQIKTLPTGQLWRHNTAGDLPGKGNRINKKQLLDLVEANKGRKGFTYTHKPLTDHNIKLIRAANNGGFTVNISANNIAHADQIRAKFKDIPLTVVMPADQLANTTTKAGHKIVICPAVKKSNVSCNTCKLCANPGREIIIGFPVHGAGKNKAACATNNGNRS